MPPSPDSTVRGIEVSNLTAITHLVDEEKNRRKAGRHAKDRPKADKGRPRAEPVPADDDADDGTDDNTDNDRPTIDYLA